MKNRCKKCKHYDKTQILSFLCYEESDCPANDIKAGKLQGVDLDIDSVPPSLDKAKIREVSEYPVTLAKAYLAGREGIDLDDAVAMQKKYGIVPGNPVKVKNGAPKIHDLYAPFIYEVKVYTIQSDHLLATPQYSETIYLKLESSEDLDKAIALMKDDYGHPYEEKRVHGFTHISNYGALDVKLLEFKKNG